MSREAVATALDEAAEALARAAHALRGMEPSVARADVQGPSRPAAAEAGVPPAPASAPLPRSHTARTIDPQRPPEPPRLPQRQSQESAFTECPAHRKPWSEGRYGEMCTGRGEPDGNNWVNDKGYCKVTPRSAGAWVKQHPQGAPAPRREFDPEEVPF